MRLYYHRTDGGAEYLCSEPVEGAEEGKIPSRYVVRIDGDIRKDAELYGSAVPSPDRPDRPDRWQHLTDKLRAAAALAMETLQNLDMGGKNANIRAAKLQARAEAMKQAAEWAEKAAGIDSYDVCPSCGNQPGMRGKCEVCHFTGFVRKDSAAGSAAASEVQS